MGEIWVVRHGETEWSATGRHTSITDIPLTEAGEEQARGLTFRLNRDWAAVMSSPRIRAMTTARLAGFEPLLEQDLAEWDYGAAEGRTTTELSAQRPWTVWDEPLGEPIDDLASRCRRLLNRLPDGDVLLFGHNHCLRVLTAVYLGLHPGAGRHFVLGPARIGILTTEHDYRAIRAWNL